MYRSSLKSIVYFIFFSGAENTVAMELIVQHVHDQLEKVKHWLHIIWVCIVKVLSSLSQAICVLLKGILLKI